VTASECPKCDYHSIVGGVVGGILGLAIVMLLAIDISLRVRHTRLSGDKPTQNQRTDAFSLKKSYSGHVKASQVIATDCCTSGVKGLGKYAVNEKDVSMAGRTSHLYQQL
jgi:gas vesicle protein